MEYQGLMNWLQNDLRIINGQLMCYSSAYLEGLHKQVKVLSDIESSLDTLGAQFYSDVVNPFMSTGQVKTDLSGLTEVYNNIFYQKKLTIESSSLINLNSIITQKFNQYINSEQRFLKNIYNFRTYFNSLNIFTVSSGTSNLYDVTYLLDCPTNLELTNGEKVILSFNKGFSYEILTKDAPIIEGAETTTDGKDYTNAFVTDNLYYKIDDQYIMQKTPNVITFTEFYVPQVVANNLQPINSNHQYNGKNDYYILREYYQLFFLRTDEETAKEQIITKDGKEYVKLSVPEIKKFFVNQHIDEYYIRDTETKVPFDWVRCNLETVKKAMNVKMWAGLTTLSYFNKDINYDKMNNDQWQTC